MATDKQNAANKSNARKCAGPTTEAGKAKSSQNALKSGIYAKADVIRTESQSEYEELIAAFHASPAPATPSEVSLVDALIRFEWLSRRYMRADGAVRERRFDDTGGTDMASSSWPPGNLRARLPPLRKRAPRFRRHLKATQSGAGQRSSLPDTALPDIAPEIPDKVDAATKPLNNELVSFPTRMDTASSVPPQTDQPPAAMPENPQNELHEPVNYA